MNEVDPHTMAEASRRYAALRRWFWRPILGMVVIWVALALLTPVVGSLLPSGVRNALIGAFVAGFLGCWVGSLWSGSRLWRFRCPRCGGRFRVSSTSTWPTNSCKHCDLDLGSALKPDAKDPSWDLDA